MCTKNINVRSLSISFNEVVFDVQSTFTKNRYIFVDQVQSIFTKNRYILDNMACAHEIIAAAHNSDIEAAFLKLDFEKVFDSVSWDF